MTQPSTYKTGWPWIMDGVQKPYSMPNDTLWPKISIITPSYNQGQFLEETILSVLNQGYPNLEYIIIDAGSTDDTLKIIHQYSDHISYWVSEPDDGQSDAINKGWRLAKGDILAWLNADDIYLPGTLHHVAQTFNNNPQGMVLSGAGYTAFEGSCKKRLYCPPSRLDPYHMISVCGDVPLQPSLFIRRQVFERIGPLRTELHNVMDWEYWIRIGLNFSPRQSLTTDQALSVNREWEGTKTNMRWQNLCDEHRSVLDEIFSDNPHNARLTQIRQAAYRSSFRKQADLARRHAGRKEAIKAVYQAFKIKPISHNPAREIYLILHIILGPRYSGALRMMLRPITRLLNKKIGF